MAREIINVGSTANDGTGDTLRASMQKINSNLAELYGDVRVTLPNRWYPIVRAQPQTGSASNQDQIRWTPMPLRAATSIVAVGARIATLSSGANIQIGVYASGADGLPTGSALISTGNLDATFAVTVSASFSAVTLNPGLYWFGVNTSNNTVAWTSVASSDTSVGSFFTGTSSLADLLNGASSTSVVLSTAQTFGTWPTNPTLTVATSPGTPRMPFGAFQTAA